MQNKNLKKTLRELDFKHSLQEECNTWCKVYNGFRLFIVEAPNGKLLSSITVRSLEISLPLIPDEYWIIEFDKENSSN